MHVAIVIHHRIVSSAAQCSVPICIRGSVFGFVRKHMDTTMCRHGTRIVLSSSSSSSSWLNYTAPSPSTFYFHDLFDERERENLGENWKSLFSLLLAATNLFCQQKPFPAPARQEFIAFIWIDMEMHTRVSPAPLAPHMYVMNYLFPRHIFVFRHYCEPAMATGTHPGGI